MASIPSAALRLLVCVPNRPPSAGTATRRPWGCPVAKKYWKSLRWLAKFDPLRGGLQRIARDGCQNYTSGDCRTGHGRTIGSKDLATRFCYPCIAKQTLEDVDSGR